MQGSEINAWAAAFCAECPMGHHVGSTILIRFLLRHGWTPTEGPPPALHGRGRWMPSEKSNEPRIPIYCGIAVHRNPEREYVMEAHCVNCGFCDILLAFDKGQQAQDRYSRYRPDSDSGRVHCPVCGVSGDIITDKLVNT